MLFRLRFPALAALAALIGMCGACDSRHTPAGLHLPKGDVDRGKVAFLNLGCHECHEVPGAGLPTPEVQPAVPVKLGGVIDRRLSDGYIITSLLDPSYHLAPFPKEAITSDGKSRMPSYAHKMTVEQMIDIVAFLQSRYMLERWSPQVFN